MPDEKVAVVTGASRGLGSVFARVLAEEGFAVCLGARDYGAVERLAAGLPSSLAYSLDVGNPASVAAFREAVLGRVVAEAVRFALRLPATARLEEVVIRSSLQAPEY